MSDQTKRNIGGIVKGIINSIIKKFTSKEFRKQAIWTLFSILLALVVSAVIMIITGYNPGQAFLSLFLGAIVNFDQVLFNATPLILTGLSVALAFKAGLFNIGAEGQLYMGSIAATAMGYMIALPAFVHPIACMAVGVLAGGLYGLLPGLLKSYRGAHEVVTTMMLSYTAVLFTQWLAGGLMHNPGDSRTVTPFILDTAVLPKLFGPFLNWGFIVAVLCVIGVSLFISNTVMGYEMRAVGSNEDAAETAGINSKKTAAMALGISGGLAGLAGAEEVLGYYHRFYDGWSVGIGFEGITVAVLGVNNPWGVFAAAIFFGALKTGGATMQAIAGVPAEMVGVIQGLVVLFVAAPRIIDWLSDRGLDYSNWIKENPSIAVPALSAAIVGLIGLFAGLILGVFYVETNIVVAGVLITSGFIGFMAFVMLYSRNKQGPILLLFSSICWLIAAVLDLASILGGVAAISLILGVLGIILSIFANKAFHSFTQYGVED